MKMVRYKQDSVPPLTEEEENELKVLAERADSEIDCSDIPELDDSFWETSMPWKDVIRSDLYRPKKITITAKLDADIVEWLKRQFFLGR